jgi:hypothetical protein
MTTSSVLPKKNLKAPAVQTNSLRIGRMIPALDTIARARGSCTDTLSRACVILRRGIGRRILGRSGDAAGSTVGEAAATAGDLGRTRAFTASSILARKELTSDTRARS